MQSHIHEYEVYEQFECYPNVIIRIKSLIIEVKYNIICV